MILMGAKEIAISKMKRLFGEDDKRIDHALKVLRFSEEILQGENTRLARDGGRPCQNINYGSA